LKPDDQRCQRREDDESPQERFRREPERGAHTAQYTVQVRRLIRHGRRTSRLLITMKSSGSRIPGGVEASTA
jgi:hypothetical protein